MSNMYNRYIPQPDGSYRRSRVQEPSRQQRPEQPRPPVYTPPEPEHCEEENLHTQSVPQRPNRREGSVGGFLRQLLPRDFDTGDLIIVLLLLLMAGDCEEDRSNALLTLALYFMM